MKIEDSLAEVGKCSTAGRVVRCVGRKKFMSFGRREQRPLEKVKARKFEKNPRIKRKYPIFNRSDDEKTLLL